MFATLRALPLLWRLLTIGSVLAALAGGVWAIYAHIRAEGYREGYAKASAECEAEQRAQELANRNAIDAANKRLLELANQLSLKELQVDDYVKAIDLATAQDPRGADACLDPDGVRRLNTLR
jgi:hypothetical protein